MAVESTLELGNNDERMRSDENLLISERSAVEDDDTTKGKVIESIEMTFKDIEIPSWKEQLTVRAFVVSAMLGVMFSFIVMKLSLTTGIIPSLNVAAGLLGFFFVKTWTKVLEQCGMLKHPFTRQENTVIQTCVVATSGIAFSGGFGSYLFGMSDVVASQSSDSDSPTRYMNIKNPSLGWIIGFLFVVSFIGLCSVVPLRKIMIIDFKLIYPSGTATAHLINSFHTSKGAKLAKQQVNALGKFFSFSFLWSFFQWFFVSDENECGFQNFPTFGLKAKENMFYFDFSTMYVGVGMICPYIINVSLLFGMILSWGIMWPLIEKKEGHWFEAGLKQGSFHGIQGYRVFTAIAIILGDGLYNFVKVLGNTGVGLYGQLKAKKSETVLPVATNGENQDNAQATSFDDQRRKQMFMKDQISTYLAVGGYLAIAAIATITLPHIFHPLEWYYVVIIYIFAPALAFCNAYGCGLTDWSLASTYGKLAIFVIGAWAGKSQGGVLAGLAACGVMMNIVSTASDLMSDFKTGYLTLASPRSMFVSQVIGTAMGCVIAPCVFWVFYSAFPNLGQQDSEYPAPYATVYRNLAILGVEGFEALPKNCLNICYGLFAAAIFINVARDTVPKKWGRFIPIPMAIAIPFYIPQPFAIDMCVGSLILFIWEKRNKTKADAFGPAVASGLICGEGLWSVPKSVLALTKVNPPICMRFFARGANLKVDDFLKTLSR
ncbi:putative metal-nicotianamine transporter YSL7 [Bidens hawaiensis]|uniref:putative metal-nicotianamine transporter YSL7 n=1 Tax=Bidens hawaiensis TaxID=980011 RepID=UPI00404915E4